MNRRKNFGYTLVQHSGYGYADKPGFQQGLEVRSIERLSERNLVQRVGGVIYEDWLEADEASWKLMFPEPMKKTFSDVVVGDRIVIKWNAGKRLETVSRIEHMEDGRITLWLEGLSVGMTAPPEEEITMASAENFYPQFKGSFSEKMIDNLRIAIVPKAAEVPEGMPF